jgi:2-polyprenyl-3-methyl-5-hydroxy-6-metoxy-1,4-benzoquinol methylase
MSLHGTTSSSSSQAREIHDFLYAQSDTKEYTTSQSHSYQIRKFRKNQAELKLVQRALKTLRKNSTILDIPCGFGRMSVALNEQGFQVRSADISEAMLLLAQENFMKEQLPLQVEKQNIFHTTYANQEFEATLCFRLFHHFVNPYLQMSLIEELCRISSQAVVLSYLTPWSPTSLIRLVKTKWKGLPVKRAFIELNILEHYFSTFGFHLSQDFAQLPYFHSLHLAVFSRKSEEKSCEL